MDEREFKHVIALLLEDVNDYRKLNQMQALRPAFG